MAIVKNQAFQKTEGYGVTGCKVTLNLAQCQKLSSLFSKLQKVHLEEGLVLTDVESEMLPFLSLFKDFTNPDSADLWDNLAEKQEQTARPISE